MEDVLLKVGSTVKAQIGDAEDCETFLIIGKRIINPFSMRAWDYVAVTEEKGLERIFKSDKSFDCDNFIYFNHEDITKIIKNKESMEEEQDE